MYHRFAEGLVDPWELCVAPENVAAHLRLLTQRYRVVSLAQLARELRSGQLTPRTVAVTIDDGYADNLSLGAPLLAQFGIPATLFVTTNAIDATREFWWDELERLILAPEELPPLFELSLHGAKHSWRTGDAARVSPDHRARHAKWRAHEPPPTPRHAMYRELWTMLYEMPSVQKWDVLEALREWSGARVDVRPSHRTLTRAELERVAQTKGMHIGAHGVTHDALVSCNDREQYDEIATSKRLLEEWLGQEVFSFAYPNGAYDDRARATVRELGFAVACTTHASGVSANSPLDELPRVGVRNWGGGADGLEQHLLYWLGE